MAPPLSLYLDEHLSTSLAKQLRRRGITVHTLKELEALGDSDIQHLQRATEMGCVLCTQDDDFLRLAAAGVEHAGIVFGKPGQFGVGEWVKNLVQLHAEKTAEEMRNQIVFLRRA